MFYSNNTVTESIAVIFVNTHARGLVYKGAEERAEMQRCLFEDVLEFNDVLVFRDFNKSEII